PQPRGLWGSLSGRVVHGRASWTCYLAPYSLDTPHHLCSAGVEMQLSHFVGDGQIGSAQRCAPVAATL
ncbi:hypothetical protein OAO87_03600, partial [bacterium]|nr:hypothetical protein [bacterium]